MSAQADADGVARMLSAVAGAADALHRTTVRSAEEGLARVKANASGRPGPRRVWGDYTRSMTLIVSYTGGGVTADIGTDAAQALRLEYGFHGEDSRGRHYKQDPLPHWRLMWEWLEPRYFAAAEDAVVMALVSS